MDSDNCPHCGCKNCNCGIRAEDGVTIICSVTGNIIGEEIWEKKNVGA